MKCFRNNFQIKEYHNWKYKTKNWILTTAIPIFRILIWRQRLPTLSREFKLSKMWLKTRKMFINWQIHSIYMRNIDCNKNKVFLIESLWVFTNSRINYLLSQKSIHKFRRSSLIYLTQKWNLITVKDSKIKQFQLDQQMSALQNRTWSQREYN